MPKYASIKFVVVEVKVTNALSVHWDGDDLHILYRI